MLKQLEAMIALKPKIVVPAHGPLGDVTDLQALTDYLLTARQKVRAMMSKGLSLAEIEKQFNMSEYQGWDRDSHFPWTAETIYRELQGQDPLIVPMVEHTVKATISKLAEEGRFLTVTADERRGGAAADQHGDEFRRHGRPLGAAGRHEGDGALSGAAGRQCGARL